MTCKCKCEDIKFGCGITTPDFNIGKCVFPAAMSLDLNIGCRQRCVYYVTDCQFISNAFTNGIIDCYDRQATLDAEVNGTYILERTGAEDTFAYRFSTPQDSQDIIYDCYGTCHGCYSDQIIISAGAARCLNFSTGPGCGLTGTLFVRFPLVHMKPSIFPRMWGSIQNHQPVGFGSIDVEYMTNQPITCDGPVTFVIAAGASSNFGYSDGVYTNSNDTYTNLPPVLTLTPVTE